MFDPVVPARLYISRRGTLLEMDIADPLAHVRVAAVPVSVYEPASAVRVPLAIYCPFKKKGP
jgi:hypothetical protein